jgi:hypothetical protein
MPTDWRCSDCAINLAVINAPIFRYLAKPSQRCAGRGSITNRTLASFFRELINQRHLEKRRQSLCRSFYPTTVTVIEHIHATAWRLPEDEIQLISRNSKNSPIYFLRPAPGLRNRIIPQGRHRSCPVGQGVPAAGITCGSWFGAAGC